jgi:UDP-N-acetylglucosamine 4-epimerase
MTIGEWLPDDLKQAVATDRRRWLVTGAAGFIGSNLVEALLGLGQEVVGLDNFATGRAHNFDQLLSAVGAEATSRFTMLEVDIRDRATLARSVDGIDIVLHQAALGSVPRSIADPLTSHDVNVTGFVNMLDAARQGQVPRFLYAASSSTYGDEPSLPKREERIGNALSPYAATKFANEIYAGVYARSYGYKATGLRYFNIFGPRQDPEGAYAAVIPKWVAAMIANQDIFINGDGETSRDFCFVANAVQANLRGALAPDEVQGEIYNVAVGEQTSLNDLHRLIAAGLRELGVRYDRPPQHAPFRAGDVRHSLADVGKAERLLGYHATHDLEAGLTAALPWYVV